MQSSTVLTIFSFVRRPLERGCCHCPAQALWHRIKYGTGRGTVAETDLQNRHLHRHFEPQAARKIDLGREPMTITSTVGTATVF